MIEAPSTGNGEQPWFRPNFGSNFGNRVTSLPFDHQSDGAKADLNRWMKWTAPTVE
ncbi:hypothetical protein [Sorangium sp. So ce363]|uniref:hypothetical protein n=1 Tax=Sorangium sp. So ce363 TaxID=3133304 RepID=UPI003F613876